MSFMLTVILHILNHCDTWTRGWWVHCWCAGPFRTMGAKERLHDYTHCHKVITMFLFHHQVRKGINSSHNAWHNHNWPCVCFTSNIKLKRRTHESGIKGNAHSHINITTLINPFFHICSVSSWAQPTWKTQMHINTDPHRAVNAQLFHRCHFCSSTFTPAWNV